LKEMKLVELVKGYIVTNSIMKNVMGR